MRDFRFAVLSDSVWLFKKHWAVWDSDKDELTKHKSLEEAATQVIGGVTVGELINRLDTVAIQPQGNGRIPSGNEYKFGSAGGGGGGAGRGDFPARANTRIKEKTFEAAVAEFRKTHVGSDTEHLYSVDENGYVWQYNHGNATSVAAGRGGRKFTDVHNHPAGPNGRGENFSDADLIGTAQRGSAGIIAVAPEGNYSFKVGTHFKADAFARAVKKARFHGKDYSSAAGRWLKQQAKRYGYTYSFTPASKL